jgi:putative transposase
MQSQVNTPQLEVTYHEYTAKIRIYPTLEQDQYFARNFGCERKVWNTLLERISKQLILAKESKSPYPDVRPYALQKELPALKEELPYLKESLSHALQITSHRLGRTLLNCYKKKCGFPRFKGKFSRQSMSLTRDDFKINDGKLYLSKLKTPIKVRWHVPLTTIPSSLIIIKEHCGRYYACFTCIKTISRKKSPPEGKQIGIDLGIPTIITTSDGEKIQSLKHLSKYYTQIAKLQRKFAKLKKETKRREKYRIKIARKYQKVTDCKRDYLHKTSKRLVDDHRVIVLEGLDIPKMVKDHPFTAKYLLAVSMGELRRMLCYKALWSDSCLVVILDTWFPSTQLCSTCQYRHEKMDPSIKFWTCPTCGSVHDRDINASINILQQGQYEIVVKHLEHCTGVYAVNGCR